MNSREIVMGILAGKVAGPVPWLEIETRDELIARTYGLADDAVDWPTRVRYAKEFGQDIVGFSHWDRFGCDVINNGDVLGFNARVKDQNDMDKFLMPDDIDREKLIENVKRAKEAIGDSGLALFVSHLLCLDPVIMDMGFENFCVSLYTNLDFVKELMERYVEYYIKIDELYSSLPEIDFIWIGEDIAFNSGTYIRPEMFMEIVYPYFKQITSHIKKPWIYHSDGNYSAVLDDLLKLGMSAIHPMQPEAMDIREVKRNYGDRVALVGNVNLNTLSLGSEEDVEKEVRGLMDDLHEGGHYMISSSNSLAAWLKPENVIAMGRAKREWNKEHGWNF